MKGEMCAAAFHLLTTSSKVTTHFQKRKVPLPVGLKPGQKPKNRQKYPSNPLPKGRAISIKPGSDLLRNFGGSKE